MATKALLSLPLLVEPDRRRFARFALEAVKALDGNLFDATGRTGTLLEALRRRCRQVEGGVQAELTLDGNRLLVVCGRESEELCRLPLEPPLHRVEALAERLRGESETADPELLRQHNREVSLQLEQARARAEAELAELEAMLDRKKRELQESIRKAETDSLTGLLNRGAFDRRLDDGVGRSHRQGEPLALIVLDLDHFKEINDTHGHQYGDFYLQRFAEAMARAAREGVDHLCRFGGDEFAIIVYAGVGVAERIAHRVLALMDGRVSIGVAELEQGESAEELMALADGALYKAKRGGRGRVVVRHGQAEQEPSASDGTTE